MKAVNSTNTQELAGTLTVADSLSSRMIGLLGRNSLACDEGLWIKPCRGVHTFGMKFPVDVVFLNEEHKVVKVKKNVRPNSMTAVYASAASVLELPAGKVGETETKPGDMIMFF